MEVVRIWVGVLPASAPSLGPPLPQAASVHASHGGRRQCRPSEATATRRSGAPASLVVEGGHDALRVIRARPYEVAAGDPAVMVVVVVVGAVWSWSWSAPWWSWSSSRSWSWWCVRLGRVVVWWSSTRTATGRSPVPVAAARAAAARAGPPAPLLLPRAAGGARRRRRTARARRREARPRWHTRSDRRHPRRRRTAVEDGEQRVVRALHPESPGSDAEEAGAVRQLLFERQRVRVVEVDLVPLPAGLVRRPRRVARRVPVGRARRHGLGVGDGLGRAGHRVAERGPGRRHVVAEERHAEDDLRRAHGRDVLLHVLRVGIGSAARRGSRGRALVHVVGHDEEGVDRARQVTGCRRSRPGRRRTRRRWPW